MPGIDLPVSIEEVAIRMATLEENVILEFLVLLDEYRSDCEFTRAAYKRFRELVASESAACNACKATLVLADAEEIFTSQSRKQTTA